MILSQISNFLHRPRWLCGMATLAVCGCLAATSSALIFLEADDPPANKTAPTGTLANSGWQFEGQWGGFLGTPIAPHFFLSAKHIGQAGAAFEYSGATFAFVQSFPDPNSDFLLWQVAETFPDWAPLYTKQDEAGRSLVVIGCGAQRGSPISINDSLRGWNWGTTNYVRRWGQNTVSRIATLGPGNDALYAPFDQNGGSNEAHFSSGDSGGGVFLNDQDGWKLAGINYAVDGPFYTDDAGGGKFLAALFDARGFYYYKQSSAAYVLLGGSTAVRTGFYATRVSSKLGWIYSVIDPTGDLDGDGIPNLMEYALRLDPLAPDAAGSPKLAQEGDALTLTYSKYTLATDVTFAVEQSADLVSWSPAPTQDQIGATVNYVQTVKSSVAFDASKPLFLRLKVTRP